MLSAIEQIKEDYEYEDAIQIISHGCESGVCFEHIYYADTAAFFDKYEDEIIDYIDDNYGSEVTEQLWTDNPCNLIGYKNAIVWTFIEFVCNVIVEEYESTTCEELDDEPIKLYADYSHYEAASLSKQGFEVVNS